MSDAKPCRWLNVEPKEWLVCGHPLLLHHGIGDADPRIWSHDSAVLCHGCPCHEPAGEMEYTAPMGLRYNPEMPDAKCVLIGPDGERREFPLDTPHGVINAAVQAMNRNPKSGHDKP